VDRSLTPASRCHQEATTHPGRRAPIPRGLVTVAMVHVVHVCARVHEGLVLVGMRMRICASSSADGARHADDLESASELYASAGCRVGPLPAAVRRGLNLGGHIVGGHVWPVALRRGLKSLRRRGRGVGLGTDPPQPGVVARISSGAVWMPVRVRGRGQRRSRAAAQRVAVGTSARGADDPQRRGRTGEPPGRRGEENPRAAAGKELRSQAREGDLIRRASRLIFSSLAAPVVVGRVHAGR